MANHSRGLENSNWRGGKVAIECEVCGTKTLVYPSRVGRRKYCSRPCQAIGQRMNYSGENCVHWKGGITPKHRAIRASTDYKKWRGMVFARDNWTCQDCGERGVGNLHAHHIFSFADFPEHHFEVWNGITLCCDCHQRLHPEVNLNIGLQNREEEA
jgi:5-methylcytosine-specific restriction endonuclease McrA